MKNEVFLEKLSQAPQGNPWFPMLSWGCIEELSRTSKIKLSATRTSSERECHIPNRSERSGSGKAASQKPSLYEKPGA